MFNSNQNTLLNPMGAIAGSVANDEDRQSAQSTMLGQLAMLALAAGQRQTAGQRAATIAGAAPVIGGYQRDVLNAAQARLMQSKATQEQQELERQNNIMERLQDPAFAKSVGLTPEMATLLGPRAIDVMENRLSRDPTETAIRMMTLKALQEKSDPNYEINNRTAQADQLGLTGPQRTMFIANGKVPEPDKGDDGWQLVDQPGGGKAWAKKGTNEVVPISGAGKGGIDPELAKRTEAEDKNLTYAKEAIAANKVLADPNYSGELTSGWNKKLNMIPTIDGSWAGSKYLSGDRSANSFVDSVVRPRSGAVVGKEELENNRKIYTPSPGDTPEQLADKAMMRAQHIQSLIAGANPADRQMLQKMYEDTVAQLQQMYPDAAGGASAAPAVPAIKTIRQVR